MTVAVGAPTEQVFVGAGTASPLSIAFDFVDPEDLIVTRIVGGAESPAPLVRGVDYAATGGPGGGAVTPLAAIPAGTSWRVRRATPVGQPASFPSGQYRAEQHERALDRLGLILQEQAREAVRAVRTPRGELGIDVPPASERANRFFAFGPNGELVPSSGTGADAGLREDLAEALQDGLGGELVRYRSSIPSFPAIMDIRKLGSRYADLRDWDGLDATGDHDNASLVQDAINQATSNDVKLEVAAGIVALGSTVEIPPGGVIEGIDDLYKAEGRRGRSMFHIGHSGKGFTLTGPTGGRAIRRIATRREQPPLAVGWEPNDHDWDFFTSGATDIEFTDILLVNPTRGICHANGGGRFYHDRVWGQPLLTGIQVDVALDLVRSHNTHFWDFWSGGQPNQAEAYKWLVNNATAYYSKRNDNPDIFSLFTIFYRHGLRIGNFAGLGGGTTSRMRAVNVGLDAGGGGLTVDADANGATISVDHFYAQGYDDDFDTGGSLIDVLGTNCDIRVFGKTDLTKAHNNAVRLLGAGSGLSCENLVINSYNMSDGNHPAVFVSNTAFGLTLRGQVAVAATLGGGGTPAFSGPADKIRGPMRMPYMPTVAAASGTLGGVSVNSAEYVYQDGFVEVYLDITITDNGSGSGGINVSLPIAGSASFFGSGYGREIATSGKVLFGQVQPGTTNLGIATYDNAYPVVTGSRIVMNARYRA